MQQIFKSLTLSLAAMGNVSIVVLLFFLIFAILGTQVCVCVCCSWVCPAETSTFLPNDDMGTRAVHALKPILSAAWETWWQVSG